MRYIMKKRKVKPILVIAALALTMNFAACAQKNQYYNVDEPYDFPVTSYDEEWDEFETKVEAELSCQIPEEILKEMTTEALLETVLNYPFLIDYVAYDRYYDAAEKFMRTFNGFEELLSRDDLTAVLLKAYGESALQKDADAGIADEEYTDSQDPEPYLKDYWRIPYLEFLIAYDHVANDNYTEDEETMLEALLSEKNSEREKSGLYSENSNIYEQFMMQLYPDGQPHN